jgi:hypothetical protein
MKYVRQRMSMRSGNARYSARQRVDGGSERPHLLVEGGHRQGAISRVGRLGAFSRRSLSLSTS